MKTFGIIRKKKVEMTMLEHPNGFWIYIFENLRLEK
jgi:hypothetical protein